MLMIPVVTAIATTLLKLFLHVFALLDRSLKEHFVSSLALLHQSNTNMVCVIVDASTDFVGVWSLHHLIQLDNHREL